MGLIKVDYGSVDGGGADVQYALTYSQFYNSSGTVGSYYGWIFDSEGNKFNQVGTFNSDYVSANMSGDASSSSITITAKKAGYYNVLGTKYTGSSTAISTREYKEVGETIFTLTNSASTRWGVIQVWLEK